MILVSSNCTKAMISRMICLCRSNCGGRAASTPNKTSEIVSQTMLRWVNCRDVRSRMGACSTQNLLFHFSKQHARVRPKKR
jgi:hypothetical protein